MKISHVKKNNLTATNNDIELAGTVRARSESEAWDVDAISNIPSFMELITGHDDHKESADHECEEIHDKLQDEIIQPGEDKTKQCPVRV